MTTFKVAMIILVALCIIGEMAIGWCISQMFEVMRNEYVDLIKDINADRLKYFDEWGLALDGWKTALNEWGDTIKIFKDCLDEEGEQE